MANRKIKFDFNPFSIAGVRVRNSRKKQQILRDVKDFVLESVLSDVGGGKSPVTGRNFKRLNEDYADNEKGGNRTPNLELKGDLLDGVRIIRKDESKLRLTVTQSQQAKADGHNNFTGKSSLPSRKFVPDAQKDENFSRKIQEGITRIVKRGLEDE